jgi:hypothetical protein
MMVKITGLFSMACMDFAVMELTAVKLETTAVEQPLFPPYLRRNSGREFSDIRSCQRTGHDLDCAMPDALL